MDDNQFYILFEELEKKLTWEEYEKDFNTWSDVRDANLSEVKATLESKGVDLVEVYMKLIPVDKTLWQFHQQYNIIEKTAEALYEYGFKPMIGKADRDYQNKYRELENPELENTTGRYTEIFKRDMLLFAEGKKKEAEFFCDAKKKELQEFREWLQKERIAIGVAPYPGGEDPHKMPIFTGLIGELGDMLNPHFLELRDKRNPPPPKLKKKCAELIAEILNGFFVNLDLAFDWQRVYQRYDRFKEKQKKINSQNTHGY